MIIIEEFEFYISIYQYEHMSTLMIKVDIIHITTDIKIYVPIYNKNDSLKPR